MHELLKFFQPFRGVSARWLKGLALFQAIFIILVWIVSPDQIIPGPLAILHQWDYLARNEGMLLELKNSAITIWEAMFWSSLIAFSIAFLSSAAFFQPISKWLTAFRFLGFAGITYVFTMWASDGAQLKLMLLTFGMTVFLLRSAVTLVESIKQDINQVDYARTLRLHGWRLAWEVIVRAHLYEIIELIIANAAIGWVMLSMVEGLVRSEGGIGALLLNQTKGFILAGIFALQLTILVYGIVQDVALRWIQAALCPYVKGR